MSEPKLIIRGDIDLKTMSKTLENLNALTDALAKDLGVKPCIRWAVTNITYKCDGCGVERPKDAAGWTEEPGLDWCPACSQPALFGGTT